MTSTVDNSSLEIANKLLQQGKIQEAVAEYRRGIELTPDLSWHHYYLGEALTQLEDWEGAVSAYRQAISLGSNYLCYYRLGVALVKLERWDDAIEVLNQGLELKPDYYKFYLPLGQALVHQQHWEPAMEAYRKAVALKPGVAEFNLQLGYLLRRHRRFQEAAGYLQRAVDFQGDDPQLQLALGVALVEGGTDLDRAEGCLRRSLELQPDQGEAYFYLGKLCQRRDQLQDALGFYRRCGELSPGVDSALAVAAVLEKLGRPTEAVDQYRQVVLEFGECGPASLGLGRALAELERPVEAVVEWRRAVKLGVETPEVHRLLAETLVELGRWSEVVEHWKWLLERYPGAAHWRRRLALALMGLGRWTEAAAQWGEYWRVAPGSGRCPVVDFRPQKKTHGEIDHSQELSITGDLTVEFWLYLRDWPKSWTEIISKFVSDEQNEFCFRLKDDQKGQWYYGKGDGCSTSINWVPKKDIRLHEWVHVACVRKVGEYGRIYFNGVLRREADWSRESEAVGTEAPVRLMVHSNGKRFHDGKLSEVRLWNRALSGDEIREGMCEGLTGEEPGLVGLWHGDESDEGVLVDAVGHHHGRLVMAADAGKERPRVGVCGWELSHNAAGRAYTLAQLYGGFAEVELIGCLFPKYGGQVWEPIRGGEIPCHTIRVEDEGRFIEQALGLVWAHPYEVVHLSKPRMPNIILGLLYKLVWGARVIVDIDDEELIFVRASETLDLRELLESGGKLPPFQGWDGGKWTRLAVGLARAFDGVTVANPALQERYGGVVIRHGRDEARFVPSADLKRRSRERFGIAQDKKVVLFFGTPKEYKGLVATARALASLGRKDVVFAIIGDFRDGKLKEELQGIPGVDYVFVGNQPFESIPDVVAVGDVCVLLQDVGSEVSQYQIPAKLSDALGMGLVVLLSETAAVADVIESGAVVPVAEGDLPAVLDRVLSDEAECNKFRVRGRELLAAEFGFGVNGSRLAAVMDEVRGGVGVLSDELNLLLAGFPAVGSVWSGLVSHKTITKGKKIIVYTCNFGNYESVKEPLAVDPRVEYILFTDRKDIKSPTWKVVQIKDFPENPRRASRLPKILPHKYLPDHEISVYLDSTFTIKESDIHKMVEQCMEGNDIALYKHYERNCVYDEINFCEESDIRNVDSVTCSKIRAKYDSINYPKNNGLLENGFIFRKNTPIIKDLNQLWWSEYLAGPERDQLTLMYCLQLLNINPNHIKIGKQMRNNPFVKWKNHEYKSYLQKPVLQININSQDHKNIINRVITNNVKYEHRDRENVTVITPTGDRYAPFSKCLQWVLTQTVLPNQWIIVDDGDTPLIENLTLPDWVTYVRRNRKDKEPPHTLSLNLLASIDLVEYEKIFIMEDDDWYAQNYIEYMLPFLDDNDMVGTNLITYYHLLGKVWKTGKPAKHTALAQTACTTKALGKLKDVCESNNWEVRERGIVDRYWWHSFEGNKLLIQQHPKIHVGFKGLFGRQGLAEGHLSNSWGYKSDENFKSLASIIGNDLNFYKHWSEEPKKPFVIYTAIAGRYDSLKEPLADSPLFDFYVFCDQEIQSEKWRWIPFDEIERNPNITAKKPKILPHLYFPHYEWSIFIDANIFILGDLVKYLEKAIESCYPIAQFLHPERSSIFDEAEYCASKKRCSPDIMNNQLARYKAEGYNDDVSLRECNFIVRRHIDPHVRKMSAIWWNEVCRNSQRDQISYPYALWKAGISSGILDKKGKSVRNVPELYYVAHGLKNFLDYKNNIEIHKKKYRRK
ncbi:MAG: tetratricopeptide repeat protein [Limnospira sp. PMC 1240.20]|uniref:tetratricopeptide repeat protein n=1 Tax=unclassified Limnospira TaxID=2642885 RepID=UPI0028E0AEBC|nr:MULTISPECIES: tetratricopeptide repeat protein [unclassified Limnospira]MDT9194714.1 tetratricopeptide repeat protein [Limnospira sp. PMC 1245.20]MDT9210087.1 tetratricopeptide repeat protein [Limnospira sp. PMC 1252.20]MDT9215243.1 tetratricopeptide repeat protein [Limnospira sp. PMC 1256.20]MDT9220502.1 tetratricopeptide repeat protein [Limnospira sp. PMC 1240.20]MDT9256101.1 tetratricopeptide repeat protein [Limnospira sp. PMC 1254.20]